MKPETLPPGLSQAYFSVVLSIVLYAEVEQPPKASLNVDPTSRMLLISIPPSGGAGIGELVGNSVGLKVTGESEVGGTGVGESVTGLH